jgi:hypothetical protein
MKPELGSWGMFGSYNMKLAFPPGEFIWWAKIAKFICA